MTSSRAPSCFRVVLPMLAAAILLSGCIIRRENLRGPSYGAVTPTSFCPGDPMVAGYDFLQGRSCPAGRDCSGFFPRVGVSSDPAAFPPRELTGYEGSLRFTAPDVERLAVSFNPNTDEVLIPTAEMRDGQPVVVVVPSLDDRLVATREPGFVREFLLEGECLGSTPAHRFARLPGLPAHSPRLQLTEVCNANAVAVSVTATNATTGVAVTESLPVAQCVTLNRPMTAETLTIRPASFGVGTQCAATGPVVPPPTLRVRARFACPAPR